MIIAHTIFAEFTMSHAHVPMLVLKLDTISPSVVMLDTIPSVHDFISKPDVKVHI